jgi:hypothetical protein
MKRRTTIAMLLALTMTALVAIAAPNGWQMTKANAQQEESISVARRRAVTLFGLLGLARGQTARLNVVNLRSRSVPAAESTADQVVPASEPTEHTVAPVPCNVRLRFLDQRGNTIARSVESIMPGDGAFLDMPFHEAIPPGFQGRRFEIRAIVQVLRRPEETRRCATISTLEIFDGETGRTDVIYPEPPR